MRCPEDLIQVRVLLGSTISLDRERIVNDPAWAAIADKLDLTNSEELERALHLYLSSYLRREELFDSVFMPSTNGPASVEVLQIQQIKQNANDNRNE